MYRIRKKKDLIGFLDGAHRSRLWLEARPPCTRSDQASARITAHSLRRFRDRFELGIPWESPELLTVRDAIAHGSVAPASAMTCLICAPLAAPHGASCPHCLADVRTGAYPRAFEPTGRC
jgi:hypothetical protein